MSSDMKRQPSSRLILATVLSASLTVIFSVTYIILSILALVYRFDCDGAVSDSISVSNLFVNIVYRFYILDGECEGALSLAGTTEDYSVFVMTAITLTASVVTLTAAIVLLAVITKASNTYYMNIFLYGYIAVCFGSLIVDITLASHFGMDYTYIANYMEENENTEIGLYVLDSMRLGAIFFMSICLKGFIGHLINLVLLVLVVVYSVEYLRELSKSEHSIHKMGAIKAFEAPKRNDTCNHQCEICQHNRNGGAGSTSGSQLNYGYMNDDETPRSRSPMRDMRDMRDIRDSLKPEYSNAGFDRSNSWQPTPGSSRPFSYLEDVKRPAPLRPPPSESSDQGAWRREPREPWTPPVPVPDYSPHTPRRLKSALKSYM